MREIEKKDKKIRSLQKEIMDINSQEIEKMSMNASRLHMHLGSGIQEMDSSTAYPLSHY